MILSDEQIKEFIGKPARQDDIREGVRIQNEHKVHVTGEGYKDTLKSIIGEKRALDYGTRELKEPITLFLTKKIRDELSRWRNTQGTRKTYDFGSDVNLVVKFSEVLKQVWKNGSIDDFSSFLNDALYTDFGGFVIVEQGRKLPGGIEIRDGIPTKINGEQKPYIIFKALEDVHDFRLTGRKVEYLILYFGRGDADGKSFTRYRVIDDSGDYIYKVQSGKVEEDKDFPMIKNDLGYVQARQISNIPRTPLNDYVKTSHIFQTIPLLQDYLTRHAEHTISELLHASPLLALKGTKCRYKDELGHECSNGSIWDETGTEQTCPRCNGMGATLPKNSSEIIMIPELDRNGDTYDPRSIGQYIVPPTEILDHQSKELDELETRTLYSGTGIKSLVKAEMQTATEVILNIKPLEDKISILLDNIEDDEVFVTNAIGELLYKDKYKGCQIHYGRKLNIRDENLIMLEIEKAKQAGMPESLVRLLLQELVITKYRNSEADMTRALMLLDLEPISTESAVVLGESLYTSDEIKWMKTNFDDYIDRFEAEFGPLNLYEASKDYKKRIMLIENRLKKYNNERKGAEDRERAATGDGVRGGDVGNNQEEEVRV